ncbi:unnamed protein product [Moneuplotes crassus]|uniref:guanylate kinase n=1 Tax=Euplotes crassus TaxID=5936 RepID=A0AAD2D6G7_EUPCR|nr:unnamed protein product [Moneuplotes crassus]
MESSASFRPLVVVGPSGVGKGTLIKKVFDKYVDKFSFSVSYTTRDPREGEENGVHYHFIDHEQFQKMEDEDGFIESCNVHTKKYGTAVCELDRIKSEKKIPVLDIDVQGATKVNSKGIDSVFIFIKPTDSEDIEEVRKILSDRLHGRGTENEEQIQGRIDQAAGEIEAFQNSDFFTYTLINDDLEKTTERLFEIMEKEYEQEFK